MKKYYFKFILFFSFVISFFGISVEILQRFFFTESNSDGFFYNFLLFFKTIELNKGMYYQLYSSINVVFYILLLFGTLFFFKSKGKETRLLSFFYSVLLITGIFVFIRITYFKLTFNFSEALEKFTLFNYITFLILPFLLVSIHIFVSFFILKTILSIKSLDITKDSKTGNITVAETSKLERFSHFIIDNVIVSFLLNIYSNTFLQYSIPNEFHFAPKMQEDSYDVLIAFFVIRFIYYIFFEKTFGSTPAKFITGSRVTDSSYRIPGIGIIFKRTFARLIPFEAFSFFGKKGWHDSLSNTYIVKEKQEGVKDIYIIILISIFLLTFIVV